MVILQLNRSSNTVPPIPITWEKKVEQIFKENDQTHASCNREGSYHYHPVMDMEPGLRRTDFHLYLDQHLPWTKYPPQCASTLA